MVEPKELHLEVSGSTLQSPVEPGSIVQPGRESTMTMGPGQVTPGRYPGSLGGICLNLALKSPGMTLKKIKTKNYCAIQVVIQKS